MKPSKGRRLGFLLVLGIMFMTMFTPANLSAQTNVSPSQTNNSEMPVMRFGGIDQYETSAKIAEAGWKAASDAVILAAGTQPNLIDAMSAGPLAAVLKAPILLTDNGNHLNPYAKAEIARLKPQKAYITSGRAVIKPAILEELKSMGVTPVELGGFDQYETSVNIAKEMQVLGDRFTQLAVVAGWVSPADALSIGSIAASKQIPVLATTKNELPAKVQDFTDSLEGSITDSYVIGGTAVVSDRVKNSLPGYQQRCFGNTKYETNLEVLKKFSDNLKFNAVYVANGETLVDALAGVPLAAQDAAPIILTNQAMDSGLLNYAKTNLSPEVVALGGEAVVNPDTLDQLSSSHVAAGNDLRIGSNNPGMPDNLQKTLLIPGNNVTLQNAVTDYSVYVNGNNAVLKDVDIKGTLFIDPGTKGTIDLEGVTAAQAVVLSGAETGIRLKDVKIDNLKIVSDHQINIAPTGNSSIADTLVSSDTLIDASQGTWGNVRLTGMLSPENIVELKGEFTHDIFVSGPAVLKADQKAAVNKVIIMPQRNGMVKLDGPFNVVQVEQKAQICLSAAAIVNNLVTHAQTALSVEKGASVGHLFNGDFSTLTGDGAEDLPSADMQDPYPILNPEGYQTKNLSLKITAPHDGAVLEYGDITITWAKVPGAEEYAVEVSDLDNPYPYLADFVMNIPADTVTFTLSKDRITRGHHFKITVSYYMPIDPDAGYGGRGSMAPIKVQIGKGPVILPLVITSPTTNSRLSFGSPIPLRWNVPDDAGDLSAVVLVQGSVIKEFSAQNGQDVSKDLYVGNNHLTVSLKRGAEVAYQGTVDISMLPSSPVSAAPDILFPANGSTIDPNHPLAITWKPVGGATDYIINVFKQSGTSSYLVGKFYAGTLTSFQLNALADGKYDIYVRAEVDNMLRDGQLITVNAPKADPNIEPQTPVNIVPLKIVSPGNNLTFTGNEPIILQWEVPKYAGNAHNYLTISSSLSPSTVFFRTSGNRNGENINQEIQKGYKSLKPGFNHITVILSEPGSITQYQGSVDLFFIP